MGYAKVPGVLFAEFERLLRWLYPGFLFMTLVPWVVPLRSDAESVFPHATFYQEIPLVGLLALTVASGFAVYLIVRYVVHEILLVIFFCVRVGMRNNFRPAWYPMASAKALWQRFGVRPTLGEQEEQFASYLTSRYAAVHALGATWVLSLTMLVIGGHVSGSPIHMLPTDVWWRFVAGTLAIAVFWIFQAFVLARTQQVHYEKFPRY